MENANFFEFMNSDEPSATFFDKVKKSIERLVNIWNTRKQAERTLGDWRNCDLEDKWRLAVRVTYRNSFGDLSIENTMFCFNIFFKVFSTRYKNHMYPIS